MLRRRDLCLICPSRRWSTSPKAQLFPIANRDKRRPSARVDHPATHRTPLHPTKRSPMPRQLHRLNGLAVESLRANQQAKPGASRETRAKTSHVANPATLQITRGSRWRRLRIRPSDSSRREVAVLASLVRQPDGRAVRPKEKAARKQQFVKESLDLAVQNHHVAESREQ